MSPQLPLIRHLFFFPLIKSRKLKCCHWLHWGQAFIFCARLLSCKKHTVPAHTSRGRIKKKSWDKKADNSLWDNNSRDGYNSGSYKKPYHDCISNLQGYAMPWKKKKKSGCGTEYHDFLQYFAIPCISNLAMGIKGSSNDQTFIHFSES